MGKQRGAPAWEGCWIPAGAKAASGGDGERAAACARHRGRDAPLGLAAACLGTERSRGWERGKSEPLGTSGWSQRSGAGTFGSPNCPGGAQSSRECSIPRRHGCMVPTKAQHRKSQPAPTSPRPRVPSPLSQPPYSFQGTEPAFPAPCHVAVGFPSPGTARCCAGSEGVSGSREHMARGRCCRRLLAPAATRARSSDSFIKPPDFPIPLFLTSVSVSD